MSKYVYRVDGREVDRDKYHRMLSAAHLREKHRGWDIVGITASGKTLFQCKDCGRESVGPDKFCPVSRDTTHTFSITLEE